MFKTSLAFVVLALVLTGCDQVKSELSDLFSKPTVEKTLTKMDTLSSEGKAVKAIETGEAFLTKHADPNNQVRQQLVRLHLEAGSTGDAMRHLQAISATPGPVNTVGSETSTNSAVPLSPKAPDSVAAPGGASISVDGASVRVGPMGTEVRAGDAVVKIPK